MFSPGDGGADDIYLYYNASFPVGELEFYSFGRYSNRETEGTGFFRYPDGFTSLPSVYPNGFCPITLGDNTDTSVSAGLRGTNFDFDWDLSLTIGAAARYEDYDDFGDALTGKLTACFQVSDVFALRGSAGNSFRAPSLAQIGYERSTTSTSQTWSILRQAASILCCPAHWIWDPELSTGMRHTITRKRRVLLPSNAIRVLSRDGEFGRLNGIRSGFAVCNPDVEWYLQAHYRIPATIPVVPSK